MVNTVKFSQFSSANLNNSSNVIVGTSSYSGGINVKYNFTTSWTTAQRPASPYDGLLGYNTNLEQYEYWNEASSQWIQLGSSDTGTVTLVDSGTGLTGGPINTTGTLSFAPIAAYTLWANNTGITAVPTQVPFSTFLQSSNNLSDLTSTSTARSNLGVAIGTNVEAWSSILDQVASNVLPASVQANVGSYNHGTGASASTFLRGDGTWVAPSGSGSVNPGTTNEITYYAANGNTVSGLATSDNGVLGTNGSGVPSISSTTPSGLTIPQPLIQGVTNGSSAPSGIVGELINSVVSVPISLPNDTNVQITSITLSAGDWDIWGAVGVSGGNLIANYTLSISGSSASSSNFLVQSGFTINSFQYPIPTVPANITAPTLFALNVQVHANGGTMTTTGSIYARRVR